MQSGYPLTKHFTKLVNTSTECLSRVVVTETVNIPLEIWMTFTFTLVIAAVLVAGGVYMVYHGTTNNVTDFVVLGSCGSFVGFCFGSVGMIILYKSACGSRKQISWTNTVNLVQRKKNIISLNCSDRNARPAKLQIKTQPASHVNTTEASRNKPGETSQKPLSHKTVRASMTPAPLCETIKTNQPATLIQTDDRRGCTLTGKDSLMCNQWNAQTEDKRECTLTENDSLICHQVQVQTADNRPDPIASRYVILPKYSSLASMSSQSISSDVSSDSAQTSEDFITIVVAEVHAQPLYARDSCEYINTLHLDGQPNLQSPLPIYLGVSCDENVVDTLEDVSTEDKSSRPNSSVGESFSEEDIPFAYDDEDIIYRLNTSDAGNCDDSIARLLINDPLMYGHTSDDRHGYILNKCHVFTEVLVHSG